MRKGNKLIVGIISVVSTIIFGIYFYINHSAIENSAEFKGQYLYWNNCVYKEASGDYKEGNTIAKTKDGKWSINEVNGDTLHSYVVARSFFDQYLYVREDYEVPKRGEITSIYINNYNKVNNKDLINAIEKIRNNSEETFNFETDNIYQYCKEISFCFDNCPVGTYPAELIGIVNDKWVYIEEEPTDLFNKDGSGKRYIIKCNIIRDKQSLDEIKNYIKFNAE
jgi:hypothetical protein